MKEFETLVNVDNIRSAIRRLFQNSTQEIMGELFQNSQRAGATQVAITTQEYTLTIADNGHGLKDAEGFHTLLKLAESSYEDAKVLDQDPMGVGIHALFAHDEVKTVGIRSGNLYLEIDTHRWWNDRDYYTKWHERLKTTPDSLEGLSLVITAASQSFVNGIVDDLPIGGEKKGWYGGPSNELLACYGYEGILEITLNGQPVYTGLPAMVKIPDCLVDTTYQGNRLLVGFNHTSGSGHSYVNWYGQLIRAGDRYGNTTDSGLHVGAFRFYLDVRSGRPINPKSPTRQGLINDQAYRDLIRFIKDQLFAFAADPANEPRIDVFFVKYLYELDRTRASAECPYFTASEVVPQEEHGSNTSDVDGRTKPMLMKYDEAPAEVVFLSGWEVKAVSPEGEVHDFDYGLSSFMLPTGQTFFMLDQANPKRLPTKQLAWAYGTPTRTDYDQFVALGKWALLGIDEKLDLGDEDDFDKVDWRDFDETEHHVFVFSESAEYEPEEAGWVIATPDPVKFLDLYGELPFPESPDGDYESLKEDYRDNLSAWQRKMLGNCVKHDFTYKDLQRQFDKHWQSNPKVTQVEYLFESPTHNSPTHIRIHAEGYEPIKRMLYG